MDDFLLTFPLERLTIRTLLDEGDCVVPLKSSIAKP